MSQVLTTLHQLADSESDLSLTLSALERHLIFLALSVAELDDKRMWLSDWIDEVSDSEWDEIEKLLAGLRYKITSTP